ncbi:MAG: hypothetical protein ACKOPM_04855 [Novosphingobium sp.]
MIGDEPWFKVSRWHGRMSGRPIHPKGWAALLGAILAPHSGWLLVWLVPGVPLWLPGLLALLLLGPSLWWLFRLMIRRGDITDYRT